jgi:hypothetical protein
MPTQIDRLKQLVARTITNRTNLCRVRLHGYEWGVLYVTATGSVYQVGTCVCGKKTAQRVGPGRGYRGRDGKALITADIENRGG